MIERSERKQKNMHENEVIELIRNKDHAGIEKLLLYYRPLMLYIVSPILRETRDVKQSTFEIFRNGTHHILPKVLLPANYPADCCRTWDDRTCRRGKALSYEETIAETIGR